MYEAALHTFNAWSQTGSPASGVFSIDCLAVKMHRWRSRSISLEVKASPPRPAATSLFNLAGPSVSRVAAARLSGQLSGCRVELQPAEIEDDGFDTGVKKLCV